jgi:hypothetical protein
MAGKTQKHRSNSCPECGTPDHRKYRQPVIAKETIGIKFNKKFNFWEAHHRFNKEGVQDKQTYCSTKEEAERITANY